MSPLPAASIPLPERYRVLRHIANGGMASVWEARDELLSRNVAVKVLAAHLTQDETARVRFQREARAAAGLSGHPHVVTIYDIGEHGGRFFIVMELMSRSIADLLTPGRPLPGADALRWLREAGSALDAAHDARIVHRDVKPANMLLDQRDRLALADFGIARLAYEDQVTATGTLLGTSSYISPEQALGEPARPASDLYALAVVAFQMLTGDKPFQAEHFAAQARAHIEDPPPAASERNPELPAAVDGVFERALAKEPEARWPTAAALVDALEQSLGGAATAAPAAAPTVVAADATRPMPPEPAPEPEREPERGRPRERVPAAATAPPAGRPPGAGPRPPARRRRWAPVALAAALLLLAAVAAALILTAGDGDREPARSERPEPTATASPTEEPTAEPTEEPTAEPTPEPTEEPTATPTPEGSEPDVGQAARLNDQGFTLNQAGRYADALEPLARAHQLCRGSDQLDPCGYAAYNYGVALNRSGDPEAAIRILEERLERFGDNDEGDVERELRDARRDARPGRGRGKG